MLHVLPASWRAALRAFLRELSLRTAVLLLPALGPRRTLLSLAVYGWNNSGFVADLDYLRMICVQARCAQRGILECGSGLTTIMLGIFAKVPVISLEHIEVWADLINRRLRQFRMPNRASYAPLAKWADFDWYSGTVPSAVDLVVCDGPPSNTRGGRYGLLPVCAGSLLPDCLILMDDLDREDERDIVQRWSQEFQFEVLIMEDYGLLRMRRAALVGMPNASPASGA
jgi:hypothetical protein